MWEGRKGRRRVRRGGAAAAAALFGAKSDSTFDAEEKEVEWAGRQAGRQVQQAEENARLRLLDLKGERDEGGRGRSVRISRTLLEAECALLLLQQSVE